MRVPPRLLAAPALLVLALPSACGNQGGTPSAGASSPHATHTAAPADTSAGQGSWLVALTSAGGSDAEVSTTTYVSYDPSSGQTTTRTLPGVTAADGSADAAALLVSTDRRWAVPDVEVPQSETRTGRLTVYSLSDQSTRTLDTRQLTHRPKFSPVGWAFDPQRPDTLRIVGADNSVWAVSVGAGTTQQEAGLARGPWVFTNGFNHNTGVPWVESINDDTTEPAGNSHTDGTPITRAGGTVLPSGSQALAALPAAPCRLDAGFTNSRGTTWLFCGDGPQLKTYVLASGSRSWQAYGKPSAGAVGDAGGAGMPLVLPPVTS